MINGRQILAARTILRMPLRQLGDLTGLPQTLLARAENESTMLTNHRAALIKRALEAAGVIFVEENGEGPGVRLKQRQA